MTPKPVRPVLVEVPRAATIPLGAGRSLAVQPREDGAVIRVRGARAREEIEVEIAFTDAGPVVRARAAALEIEAAGEVVARCDRFAVEARDRIELRSGGDLVCAAAAEARIDAGDVRVSAETGDVRVEANDDVQILGEQVLLNAEPEPPVPAWVTAPAPAAVLPCEDVSGDAALASLVRGR